MPRILPTGLAEALKRGTLETHSTLELTLPDSATGARTLYFATAPVTVGGVKHSAQLRDTSAMKQSLTRAADRVTVDLQNVDTVLGIELINASESFYGARVRFGRYWRDIGSGAIFHKYLLTGAVVGVDVNENTARLALVSDAYAALNVGASQPVVRNCRWEVIGGYKGPQCGSTSDFLTCNYLLDHADGCSARHSGTNNRARFGGFAYIKSQASIAGAAAAPIPASNQLVKLVSTDLATVTTPAQQQPFFALNNEAFNVANDATNKQTVITPKGIPTKLFNVVFDHGAPTDGTTDATTAIQAAIDAAEAAGGGTVFLPAGEFKTTGLTINGHVKLAGSSQGEVVICSTSNAPIVDCGQSSFELPPIENIRIRGSVTAGSNQIGLRVDDATYGLLLTVRNVYIENCGGAGLYVGNVFSSFFENVFATNCAGGNYVINSANMPVLTFRHCDSGVIHSSYRTGYHIKAGNVIMRDCNSIYGGSNPEWCVTIGRRIGLYGETTANGSAFVRFEGCNFESSTAGGVQCLFNSRASFHACTWVGDGASSGSYKAVLYDACQVHPTETTGSISSGTATLVVANAATWTIGQGIKVAGAGVASADLSTTVSNISGTTFTLAANASTTVSGAAVSHTDDIFYPLTQSVLGVIDDDCGFSNSPASYYANSEPIHVTAYPATAGVIPQVATNGRGPKISGDKFVSNFRNDTTSATWPLPRMDGFLPVQTITSSTTFVGPGVRYIECNHSAPITITLPWPGWQLNSSNELIIIKDVSSAGAATNNVTIQASSGGTVNGSSFVINVDKGAVVLVPHSADDYRVVATYSPGGGITGSGTSGQVAVWNGTSSQSSDSDLTFDGFNLTAGRLYHSGGSGGAPGVSSPSDTGSGFYLSSAGVYGYASSAANGGAGGNVMLFAGDGLTVDGRLTLTEKTAPSTPSANSLTIYAKDKAGVSALYFKDDAGTETEIGGGGSVANIVQAINVIVDHGAPSDGSTDATTEVAASISAANTTGRSLYFPAGTYLVDEAVFTNLNSLSIFGDGPNRSILKSGDSTKAVLNIDAAAAASHTITIENLSIEGAATGSNNHGIYVHGSSGLFNLTLRNVHVRDCGGKGVYITNDCFTQLLEGVDVSDCGDHAIDVVSGNTTTLSRCYVHNVATNKAAYRLRYGDYTLIGCNGIDSGTTADWGVFGQNTGDDGVETYTRATLIGCNLEDFTNRGIRFKTGSFANFFSTAILAPASGTVKALEYEFVGTSATGIFDAASSINTKGASWSSGYAVHSSGAPFLQLGHTDTTSYYDTNVGGATTLPALTANLVAGSTNYALLLSRAKITALEASALVSDLTGSTSFTGDAARILLQAGSNSRPTLASTDTNGTGIYFPSSGANLAATVSGTQRLLLGTNHTFTGNVGINTAGSSSYALEVASGAARFTGVLGASDPVLELRSATNPHLLVSDTANTITARLGTLAGAPDRAFVGTMTNHPFGLYQNGSECWTINTSGHLVPGSATTYNVGSASLPVNDLYLAGTFFLAPRTDPGSPTNSDFWRSSTRNAISTRVSGQTEDLSTTMWRSSAQSSFDTTSAATSIIADTGVGTKTVAANRLAVGNQIRITAGGLFGTKASSAGTLTMRVRTGGTTMVTATFTLPDGLVDQAWSLEAVGALNTAGSSGVVYWRLAWLITDSSGVVYMPNVTTNSTAINTTTSRVLDVTAQFSASDADNYFQTDNATIEVLA